MGRYDDDDDFDIDLARLERPGRKRRPADQDGWALTSFFISIGAGIVVFVVLVLSVVFAAAAEGEVRENDPRFTLLGAGIIGGLMAAIGGLAFGVLTIIQTRHNAVFAVLGIAFNTLIILGVVGVMCFGLLVGG